MLAQPGRERGLVNITGGEGGVGDWSESELASLLKDGFTPDFDSVGGSMTAVIANWSHVTDADRLAVAAYLKAIPKHPNGYPVQTKAQ